MFTVSGRILSAIYQLQGQVGCTLDELRAFLGSPEELQTIADALRHVGTALPAYLQQQLQPVADEILLPAVTRGVQLGLICEIPEVNFIWIEEIHDPELMATVRMFDGLLSNEFGLYL
jgi:hypothetical protein